MTAGPSLCMLCGAAAPQHLDWCDERRAAPPVGPPPCAICDAAHLMCLTGDGVPAASDLIKAALVNERKAKEAAEARAVRLRDELDTARRAFKSVTDSYERRLSEARTERDAATLRLLDADALADEVAALVARRAIDSRSPAADALLRYRDPPRTRRRSGAPESRP